MATKNITDRQVCEAVEASHNNHFKEWSYDLLHKMTGEPEKVCYRALERAASRGLVEYGISLRTGWLTKRGKETISENHAGDVDIGCCFGTFSPRSSRKKTFLNCFRGQSGPAVFYFNGVE